MPEITLNTAADVSVISHAWFMSHPTLRAITIQPVPHAAVALRAANGSPLNIRGFVIFSLTLGTITHDVEALVVPSLGPDSLLLDNNVMSTVGAVLDWENQTLSFVSAGSSVPSTNRTSYPASRRANPARVSCDHTMSVTDVRHDAEGVYVSLRERADVKPGHEALVVDFTDCLSSCDCVVVVEPRIISELEYLQSDSPSGARESYCRSHPCHLVRCRWFRGCASREPIILWGRTFDWVMAWSAVYCVHCNA